MHPWPCPGYRLHTLIGYRVPGPETVSISQLTRLGGDSVDIWCYVYLDVAHGPGQAASHDVLDPGVSPDVVAMTE